METTTIDTDATAGGTPESASPPSEEPTGGQPTPQPEAEQKETEDAPSPIPPPSWLEDILLSRGSRSTGEQQKHTQEVTPAPATHATEKPSEYVDDETRAIEARVREMVEKRFEQEKQEKERVQKEQYARFQEHADSVMKQVGQHVYANVINDRLAKDPDYASDENFKAAVDHQLQNWIKLAEQQYRQTGDDRGLRFVYQDGFSGAVAGMVRGFMGTKQPSPPLSIRGGTVESAGSPVHDDGPKFSQDIIEASKIHGIDLDKLQKLQKEYAGSYDVESG